MAKKQTPKPAVRVQPYERRATGLHRVGAPAAPTPDREGAKSARHGHPGKNVHRPALKRGN